MRNSDLKPGWIEKELRANFARASRAGRRAAKTEPRAVSAAYRSQERALRIELTNGATITLPVKLISGLKGVRPKDLRAVEVLGRGGGLHWGGLDLDLSVPGPHCSLVPSGWQSSAASAVGIPPPPKQLQHAGTGARAAVRAPDRGRIPWNLDASPFRYYFMTT